MDIKEKTFSIYELSVMFELLPNVSDYEAFYFLKFHHVPTDYEIDIYSELRKKLYRIVVND